MLFQQAYDILKIYLTALVFDINESQAVAWYTPIHWKQAWEKLETDIEFDRCSVVSSTSRRHMFNWPATITTTKEKQDKCNKDISKYQMERVRGFLKR